jgi:hypothetical protein
VIGAAVKVAKIAMGEIEEDVDTPENGQERGAKSRAQARTPESRAEIAKNAAQKRWTKD